MKRLRAAVVGVGYLGRFHAQKYAAHPDVDLVAVVDSSERRAQEVAAVPLDEAVDVVGVRQVRGERFGLLAPGLVQRYRRPPLHPSLVVPRRPPVPDQQHRRHTGRTAAGSIRFAGPAGSHPPLPVGPPAGDDGRNP